MRRFLLVVVVAAGCAGGELRARSSSVAKLIRAARAGGAVSCAPIELAMAESHNDFASVELDEGDYYRAQEELEIAEKNAGEAVRKSPRGKCLRVAVETAGDRDGDGIADDKDECPERPEDKDGYEDADGCPEKDNDSDGLVDRVDECPDKPEDRDDFEDQDGCPDEDNDKDKLADKVDQCPDKAEDPDGNADDDGCPDCDDDGDGVLECPDALDKCPGQKGGPPDGCGRVVVTDKKIEIKETIFFETGRATIKPVSYPLLDEVAKALEDNPSIRIRVEGHTDSQGKDRYNLKLSRARAASVRKYLAGRGIAKRRMVSQGYGETRPIADNRTAEGRAENRRVEFVITGR
jgi:outer membrane protein OmpA-like peptidoglycan-associated protein